jgi:tRNA/rRNA methyltransferase
MRRPGRAAPFFCEAQFYVSATGGITPSMAESEQPLARVRIVLSHPSHPGNIGASARAMKTMGLGELHLVAPRRFPDAEATALASGADDVLDAARVHATLDDALAGTTLAFALTARRRDLSHPASDVRAAAGEAVSSGATVAFVFGTEMSGLSNDEVIRCDRLAHIPARPGFSSLNLAQAVQIVCYELRMALDAAIPVATRYPRASHEDLEALYAHLEASVLASGFLDPGNPRRFMERMRRMFGRAALEREEVHLLRGMLAAWDAARRKGE